MKVSYTTLVAFSHILKSNSPHYAIFFWITVLFFDWLQFPDQQNERFRQDI